MVVNDGHGLVSIIALLRNMTLSRKLRMETGKDQNGVVSFRLRGYAIGLGKTEGGPEPGDRERASRDILCRYTQRFSMRVTFSRSHHWLCNGVTLRGWNSSL
jgi:hypothetical protein